jgi:hypothetical protein
MSQEVTREQNTQLAAVNQLSATMDHASDDQADSCSCCFVC